MFCNRCGQLLPEGSRFCNVCGASVGAPAAVGDDGVMRGPVDARTIAAVADDGLEQTADESVVFRIRPTMIFVAAWYLGAVLLVLATAALLGVLRAYDVQWLTNTVAFLVIAGVGLVAFTLPVVKHIKRLREVYTLTTENLEMRYGILNVTVQNIPLRNIQEVTVTASFFQRLLKLGDIDVESASEAGRVTRLHQVHDPNRYAGIILGQLRRRN